MNTFSDGDVFKQMKDVTDFLNPPWLTDGIYFQHTDRTAGRMDDHNYDLVFWFSYSIIEADFKGMENKIGGYWDASIYKINPDVDLENLEREFRNGLKGLIEVAVSRDQWSNTYDPGAAQRVAREVDNLERLFREVAGFGEEGIGSSKGFIHEYNKVDLPDSDLQGSAAGELGNRLLELAYQIKNLSEEMNKIDETITSLDNLEIYLAKKLLWERFEKWYNDDNTWIHNIINSWYSNVSNNTQIWNEDRGQYEIVYDKPGFTEASSSMVHGIVGDGITDGNVNKVLKNRWRQSFGPVKEGALNLYNTMDRTYKNTTVPVFNIPGPLPFNGFGGSDKEKGDDSGDGPPEFNMPDIEDIEIPEIEMPDIKGPDTDSPPDTQGHNIPNLESGGPGLNYEEFPQNRFGDGPNAQDGGPPPIVPQNYPGGPDGTTGPGGDNGFNYEEFPQNRFGDGPNAQDGGPPPIVPQNYPGGPGGGFGPGGSKNRDRPYLKTDPETGLPLNPDTGQPFPVDPETDQPFDPDTGLPIATDPETGEVHPIDPITGESYPPGTEGPTLETDPTTGLPINPETGDTFPVDPETGLPYNPETDLPVVVDPETGEVLPVDPTTGYPEGYEPSGPSSDPPTETPDLKASDFPKSEPPDIESGSPDTKSPPPDTSQVPGGPPPGRSPLDYEPLNFPPSSDGQGPETDDRSSMFSGSSTSGSNGQAGGTGPGSEPGSQNGPGQGGMGGMGGMPPMMPPGMGGMGGGQGGQGQGNERQRSTWLSEDERVWGTAATRNNTVLGRPVPGAEKRSGRDELWDPTGDRARTGSSAEDAQRSGGRKRKPGGGNRGGRGQEPSGGGDSERKR